MYHHQWASRHSPRRVSSREDHYSIGSLSLTRIRPVKAKSPIIIGMGALRNLLRLSMSHIGNDIKVWQTPVQYDSVILGMRERADFVDAWHFGVGAAGAQESRCTEAEDLARCRRNCGGKNKFINKPEVMIKEIIQPFNDFRVLRSQVNLDQFAPNIIACTAPDAPNWSCIARAADGKRDK